ncbi:hypothetical protein VB773_21115 [Haloarculaceae archaeon H-GB2-1]|nr:hypothetical protein [Haloarculaceae archaeon H-GB1-1]MEA5409821.1 hypothetical protein [Haloarculaceae archaeon H-GB2-1]
MAYQLICSGNDWSNSNTNNFQVLLYPNTWEENDIAENDVADALDYVGQQLLDIDACEQYNVYISYEHPNLYDGSNWDFFSVWRNYDRPSYHGCHLCVGGENIGGRAQSPYNPGAWNDDLDAVVGCGGEQYYKNVAIQEVFHAFIDDSNPTVQSLIPGWEEHDLGSTYSNYSATSMATGYPESQDSGHCSTY